MDKRPTLSIAPYYGGKGRMAHFIVDRLNYDDTDIFVTPFGGMCRVLLNKPRHRVECYNDFSSGLCALMEVLSDPDKARILIQRLENETDHSQAVFDKQKAIFDNAEVDIATQEREKLRRFLIDKKIVKQNKAKKFLEVLAERALQGGKQKNEDIESSFITLRVRVETDKNFENAFRNVFSDPDKARILIQKAKVDLKEQEKENLRHLLINNEIVNPNTAEKFIEALMKGTLQKDKDIIISLSEIEIRVKTDIDFRNTFLELFRTWLPLYEKEKEQGFIERPADMGEYVSEMDLAIATYVVFQQSRDGMGQVWSKEKFKTDAHYKKQIGKLFDCAERLEGVNIFQIDAVDFFRRYMFRNVDLPDEEVDPDFLILNEWINNPRVMMYCDPSYISPDSEQKLLEGVNIDGVDSLADAIDKNYEGKKWPKNLGEVYACSFGYRDQERFLRCIQKANCRIMVSNYDLILYNKYLNENTGWRKEIFETTTGVGSKKNNKRTEVIWYNY